MSQPADGWQKDVFSQIVVKSENFCYRTTVIRLSDLSEIDSKRTILAMFFISQNASKYSEVLA